MRVTGDGTGGNPTPAATGGMSPGDPGHDGPRPDVYARLAHDAEVRTPQRRPPRGSRPLGWLLIALTVAAVLVAVFGTHLW